jgi:CRP-like cAMP-binding protein
VTQTLLPTSARHRMLGWLGLKQIDEPLLTGVTVRFVPKRHTLFEQGTDAQHVFFVLSGQLKIVARQAGSDTILTIISSGEIGGALLMGVQDAKYPGSIEAIVNSNVILIPKTTYLSTWVNNPQISPFLANCIQKRVRAMQVDHQLQNASVETRLANFILRHINDKSAEVTTHVTRREMASAIGAKTETVIRTIKKLERAGLIETGRGLIKVLDLDRLRQLCP